MTAESVTDDQAARTERLVALAGRLASFTFSDGTQLAKGVAQVTLLKADLRLVPWTLALARNGVRSVKWLIGASTACRDLPTTIGSCEALSRPSGSLPAALAKSRILPQDLAKLSGR